MRFLFTILIAALSLNAFSQGIPQLPYNPDENGDGLIGVPDLQALLAQYGLEFNSAVLSEDEESAIVYMGEMAHPVCNLACDNLPGVWHMSTMNDLGLVWDEITELESSIWIGNLDFAYRNEEPSKVRAYHYYSPTFDSHNVIQYPGDLKDCYCAAHELPKVEYKIVVDNHDPELTALSSQGWKLLDLGYMDNNSRVTGVMWRWAE
jgi:hypothetical protein